MQTQPSLLLLLKKIEIEDIKLLLLVFSKQKSKNFRSNKRKEYLSNNFTTNTAVLFFVTKYRKSERCIY